MLKFTLGDTCVLQHLLGYLGNIDQSIVGKLAFLDLNLSLIVEVLGDLVHIDMSQVVAHVLHEVMQQLLVALRQEAGGITAHFTESVEDLFTTDIEDIDILLGLETAFCSRLLRLEANFDHLSILRFVGSEGITSKDLEIVVHMGELLQVVNIVFVSLNVQA